MNVILEIENYAIFCSTNCRSVLENTIIKIRINEKRRTIIIKNDIFLNFLN